MKYLILLAMLISIFKISYAQYATPYLATNKMHINPIGAVLRETGNFHYGTLDTGRVLRGEIGFSAIGRTYGAEAEYVTKAGYIDNTTNTVMSFRGSYIIGESFTLGYSNKSQNGDNKTENSEFGIGLKTQGFHASYMSSEKKVDNTKYSVVSSAIGIVQSISSAEWKFEHASILASEDAHSSTQTVFELRSDKLILLLEVEDGSSYERQLLGFGWDNLDDFAFRMDLHSKNYENGETEAGFRLTAGFNYDRRKSCGC